MENRYYVEKHTPKDARHYIHSDHLVNRNDYIQDYQRDQARRYQDNLNDDSAAM